MKTCSFLLPRLCFIYNTVITLFEKKCVLLYSGSTQQMSVCVHARMCVCVCNSACVNHQLVNCPPPQSGSEVMRVTQYQTKETASLGDSSPLAEPVTAPSPHGRPRTDAHPPLSPSLPTSLTPFLPLRSVAACFLPTCMQAKTHANSPVPSPSRQKLRAPPPPADHKSQTPAERAAPQRKREPRRQLHAPALSSS